MGIAIPGIVFVGMYRLNSIVVCSESAYCLYDAPLAHYLVYAYTHKHVCVHTHAHICTPMYMYCRLVVVSRFHPEPVLMSLIHFVAPSRPVVVYCNILEVHTNEFFFSIQELIL